MSFVRRTFHRDIAFLTLFQDPFLKNFVKANPFKSAYSFTLNHQKSGHFNLCFLANKSSAVQTRVSFAASIPPNRNLNILQPQPIHVAPEAYYLCARAWRPRTVQCAQGLTPELIPKQSAWRWYCALPWADTAQTPILEEVEDMKPPGTPTFLPLSSPIPVEPSIQEPYYSHEQTAKMCTFYANDLFHRPDQTGMRLTAGGGQRCVFIPA